MLTLRRGSGMAGVPHIEETLCLYLICATIEFAVQGTGRIFIHQATGSYGFNSS